MQNASSISAILREWRQKSKKNTFSDLARRVGVSQQTISKWASGAATPSAERERQLRNALAPSDIILTNNDIITHNSSFCPTKSIPLQDLPLSRFDPYDFELLCRDLYRSQDIPDMQKFGEQGDTQFGIDLFSAETKTVIQCKQTSSTTFSKDKVRNAINYYEAQIQQLKKELKFVPRRKILAVSANLSAGSVLLLRDRGWDALTIRDITEKLRELPKNKQIRIIEEYFPNNRSAIAKDCLGIKDYPSYILEPELYFEGLENQAFKYYTLSNPFVENSSKLQELNTKVSTLLPSVTEKISPIVISGYEGLGKTRLLKEFCERRKDLDICILLEHDFLSQDSIDCLLEHDVILVDDADLQAEKIRNFISASFRTEANKLRKKKKPILILTTTPMGVDTLRESLSRFYSLADGDIIKLNESPDCTEIAKGIMGNLTATIAIGRNSSNSPFLAVATSRYFLDKGGASTDIKSCDAITLYLENLANYGSGLSRRSSTAKITLELVSMLQPVTLDNNLISIITKYTNTSEEEANTTIDTLVESRLLRKQFGKLVLMPSPLGAYICQKFFASSLAKNSSLVNELLSSKYRNSILINLAKNPDANTSNYISHAWTLIKESFLRSTIPQKANTLKELSQIAVYQPNEILDLTQEALNSFSKDKGPNYSLEYSDLFKATVSALEAIAHDINYLETSIKMLLTLPCANSSNDPVTTTLREFLSRHLFKPSGYRLAAVKDILKHINSSNNKEAIIGVLSKSLDTNSFTCIGDNRTITYYRQEQDNTDAESLKIIEALSDFFRVIATSGTVSENIAAVEMLGTVIHYYLDADALSNLRRKILKQLVDACLDHTTAEVVAAKIYLTLQRCREDFDNDEWNKLELLMNKPSLLLQILTIDPYWHDLFAYERDYEARENLVSEWISLASRKILRHYDSSPKGFYDRILDCRKVASECNLYYDSHLVLCKVCNLASIDFNKQLLDIIADTHPKDTQGPIYALISKGEIDYCIQYLEKQLAVGNNLLASHVFSACLNNIAPDRAVDLLNSLVKAKDTESIKQIILYLNQLIERDESIFPSLISSCASIRDAEISSSLCELLSMTRNKKLLGNLDDATIKNLLNPLETIYELNYPILTFLDEIADSRPTIIANFLLKRSSNDEHQTFDFNKTVFYHGLPYNLNLTVSKDSMRKYINAIAAWFDSGNKISTYNLRKIFEAMKLEGDTITELINELLNHDPSLIKAENTAIITTLLGQYRMDYLLESYEQVESIIDSIEPKLDEETASLLDFFNPCFIATSKSHTPGEPCEYDVKLNNLCSKALNSIPLHFHIRSIFLRAQAYAKQEMARDKQMDEEWGY